MAFWNRGNGEVDEDFDFTDVEDVIAGNDEFGSTRTTSAHLYLDDGHGLLEDPELSKYIIFTKDEDTLLMLGDLILRGYSVPIGGDLDILDLFNRNIELYEALARHPKTSDLIEFNDFNSGDNFELGVKMFRLAYSNDSVALGYLKEYLKYQNLKPDFNEFSEGLAYVGICGGLDGDSIEELHFNQYIKWW